jgi:hypothetical protein
MMDVTATGLIQNGMLCSGCMVPSGATADRAGSAIADFVPCWECIKFSRSVRAAWVQRCECPEAGERSSRYSIASNLGTFATDAAQPEG